MVTDLVTIAAAVVITGINGTSISSAVSSGTLPNHAGPGEGALVSLAELRALARAAGAAPR